MNRKDIFFLCLLLGCFMGSAIIMAGDYINEALEESLNKNHFHEETSDIMDEQEEILAEIVENTLDTEREQQNTNTEGVEPSIPGETQDVESGPLPFENVGYEYFDDALFIGDSRTVGIMEYAGLEKARFFADSGLSVYKLDHVELRQPDKSKLSFHEILSEKEYGKIYLMLGMNELGYSFERTADKYKETVEKIIELQSDAILYVCANLHVTREQSEKDELYNNDNIDKMNAMIAGLADGQRIFYIDVNELFDDENGDLSEEFTSDSAHVYGKYYIDWADWLCTKAVIPKSS